MDGWTANRRAVALLRDVPFLIGFHERVRIFYARIAADKDKWRQRGRGPNGMPIQFDHGRGVRVNIRRKQILADGFNALSPLGIALKGRVQVIFVDEHGMEEAGVDGGGLFKEFLTQLSKVAFNPIYGLFQVGLYR